MSSKSKWRIPTDEGELAEFIIRWIIRIVSAIIGRMGLKAFLGTAGILLSIFAGISYFAAPIWFSAIFYQSLIIYWPYVAIVLLVSMFCVIPIVGLVQNRDYGWRGIVLILTAIAVIWISFSTVSRISSLLTYHLLATFTDRPTPLVTNREIIRYTPLENAYNEIEQSIASAQEAVVLADTKPIFTDAGFAYAVQITPDDGLLPYNGFMTLNPGFTIYHDEATRVGPRIERINDPQTYGLRKAWFLNAWFQVYRNDRFAIYEDPHYLEVVNADDTREYLTVFPKIKHHYWRLPYWAGVTIVHGDGTLEDLSVAAATADPRFAKEWLAPVDLLRRYVSDQTMQAGFWNNWLGVNAAGRMIIPELDGDNQYPFVTTAADGTPYAYVTTKPIGDGDGMAAIYYMNLATGDLTRYRFTHGEVVYGVSSALARVTSIGGYTWHTRDDKGSSGQAIAIEPVYIVRPKEPEKIYWKATITNTQHKGVSAQVVFDSSDPSRWRIFENTDAGRHEFYAWLASAESVESQSGEDLYEQLVFHLSEAARHQAVAQAIAEQMKNN
jgi:hypothetical protein